MLSDRITCKTLKNGRVGRHTAAIELLNDVLCGDGVTFNGTILQEPTKPHMEHDLITSCLDVWNIESREEGISCHRKSVETDGGCRRTQSPQEIRHFFAKNPRPRGVVGGGQLRLRISPEREPVSEYGK